MEITRADDEPSVTSLNAMSVVRGWLARRLPRARPFSEGPAMSARLGSNALFAAMCRECDAPSPEEP